MSHPVLLTLIASRLAKLAIKIMPATEQSPDLLHRTVSMGEIRLHLANKVTASLAREKTHRRCHCMGLEHVQAHIPVCLVIQELHLRPPSLIFGLLGCFTVF